MPLISDQDKTVPVTVQTRAAIPPVRAFEIITPIDLSLVFKGWGPFPAVRGVNNQTGEGDHVGPSRNPVLSDGSTATERLTEYTASHSFGYELTGFTNVLRRLIHGVRGEWTFTPDGDGTVIRWTYEFKPLRGRYFLVRRGLAPLWLRYMQAGVKAAARVAEERGPQGRTVRSSGPIGGVGPNLLVPIHPSAGKVISRRFALTRALPAGGLSRRPSPGSC